MRFDGRMVHSAPKNTWSYAMTYAGFEIESFEAGKGQWHARIRRADQTPVLIDGVSFSTLEVGFAWSNSDAAVADAKTQIDYLNQRCAPVAAMPRTQLQRAS